jgi:tetraacyldisaccharide 4'-kinase
MENFAEIAAEFRAAEAVITIDSATGLTAATARILADEGYRDTIGDRAGTLARARSGAASKAAAECVDLLEQAMPRVSRGAVTTIVLKGLAQLWNAGGRWKRSRDLGQQRRLPIPVVSIGGIAMGGVGKTPFVIWLAAQLRKRGIRAAILTRGYRRRSTERVTIAAPSAKLPVDETGDEAQILIRETGSPVGIGADRYAAGLKLLEKYDADLFILDDGFQHARLARDVDIALLDALDPIAGGGLFPYGRLREPLSALARASAIILSRAAPGRTYSGLLAAIQRSNPSAPAFRSHIESAGWLPHEPSSKGAAFCGLGNPESFWSTLSTLGLSPVLRRSYPDHHKYTQRDLDGFGKDARSLGAEALWTTGKDAVNLPSRQAAGLPVLELAVRTVVDDPEPLLDLIIQHLLVRPADHAG